MNPRQLANPAFLTAVLIMVAAALGMESAISRYQIYLRKKPIYAEPIEGPRGPEQRVLRALPDKTENFVQVGQDFIESAENLETLGTDNYLTRTYAEKNPKAGERARQVQLHVAYYTGMIDTVPHVPERCLVGGGLMLVSDPVTAAIPLASEGWLPAAGAKDVYTARLSNTYSTAVPGSRVNLPRDLTPSRPLKLRVSEFAGPSGGRYFAGYFFIANGGWVSSAEDVRLLAFDLNADYAYYLKVQVASYDVSSPQELASLAGGLLDDLLGEIMTCVPDWLRVQRGLWPPDNPKRVQTPVAGQP